MQNKFQIRALQIDLNRQYENMDFIRSYIDFATDNGYNTLLLYIGWRIKMKSLPWDVPGGTYTPEDIREIVAYANSRNVDVLPTTNLTYVNSLTRVDELKAPSSPPDSTSWFRLKSSCARAPWTNGPHWIMMFPTSPACAVPYPQHDNKKPAVENHNRFDFFIG